MYINMPGKSDSYTRLFERVVVDNDTDCWVWFGPVKSSGYGTISAADYRHLFGEGCLKVSTHVYSYCVHNNYPKPSDYQIRHLCHNKRCVNPEHLTVGSHSENMRDTVDIKRINTQKLSVRDVEDLRHLYPLPDGKTRWPYGLLTKLAKRFGLQTDAITRALRGRTFKRVKVDHA